MEVPEAERTGRLVIEAKQLGFAYGNRAIVRDFSTMIMRGDRVGLIGPNGSGKTTLLRLLLGELPPQAGAVRQGSNLEVAYFDQLHAQLDETKSVRENVRDGSDSVTVNGRTRHIIGYLEDFLFTPQQAGGPVSRLSGGEQNRLLLARLFTKPSNVLVMDEPTNDLDLETLELLEDLLGEYAGTLLLVSHDREFLNNVVSSTLVLEGEGRVKEYAGGYDDWLRQRGEAPPVARSPAARPEPRPSPPQRSRRLTYHEQRELQALPQRIEALEAELAELQQRLADPMFYRRPPAEIVSVKGRLRVAPERRCRGLPPLGGTGDRVAFRRMGVGALRKRSLPPVIRWFTRRWSGRSNSTATRCLLLALRRRRRNSWPVPSFLTSPAGLPWMGSAISSRTSTNSAFVRSWPSGRPRSRTYAPPSRGRTRLFQYPGVR